MLDDTAPENVLEVTARAMTYYLDVSAECTRRIVAIDGAMKAICSRLSLGAGIASRTSKDLAEQCIKVSNSQIIPIVNHNSTLFRRITKSYFVLLLYRVLH
jgi:hypothetical protein